MTSAHLYNEASGGPNAGIPIDRHPQPHGAVDLLAIRQVLREVLGNLSRD